MERQPCRALLSRPSLLLAQAVQATAAFSSCMSIVTSPPSLTLKPNLITGCCSSTSAAAFLLFLKGEKLFLFSVSTSTSASPSAAFLAFLANSDVDMVERRVSRFGLAALAATFSASETVSMALATTSATTSLMYDSVSASAAAATDERAPWPRTAACIAVAAASSLALATAASAWLSITAFIVSAAAFVSRSSLARSMSGRSSDASNSFLVGRADSRNWEGSFSLAVKTPETQPTTESTSVGLRTGGIERKPGSAASASASSSSPAST
mmetsp:Transcript_56396/g.135316  ORF Transcript_56396/g.135316 Transcript_56396/m.135316 type:complete len:269 (-) Transcript_56396:234-1040(-)